MSKSNKEMKKGQRLWTREELILVINLYLKLPFGKLHQRNPDVISLSILIGRSAGSVAWKLVNFASLDPSLKERGIKGAVNVSQNDILIWNEFYHNCDDLYYESEKLLSNVSNTNLEKIYKLENELFLKVGEEKEQYLKTRVNQSLFRKIILASYNYTCCITGIQNTELLIAGHILPWSKDKKNRLNPRNGLVLNALHDKAFETGLITITPEYKIKISSILKKCDSEPIRTYFNSYDMRDIILPTRFLPDKDLLKYHNDERFRP